jgi:light-regulated signal transduction histidine kinase (bacteriophytochrome)
LTAGDGIQQATDRLNAEVAERTLDRTPKLQAADDDFASFSHSVSHELRSPLVAINGLSRILEKRYLTQLDEEGRRILQIIRQSTSRMGKLIDDLLAFSRCGIQESNLTEIDMQELACEVFSQSEPRPCTLQFWVGHLPPARGDRLIRQVLFNLFTNALKFTAPKERAIICIEGVAGPSENIYYVKDDGIGFDMRDADKLFGVFSRLHRSEDFAGTGLGLAIVKRIIAGHGGRVWAEGKVGEGATFYFALPSHPHPVDELGEV